MATWDRPPVPARLVASARVPFVGRRNELAAFEEVYAAVAGGTRQAVFVGGEPGAGKTRLVAEIATVMAQHDAAVLMGASTADFGVPYQPFVEMLEHLLASSPPGSLDDHLGDTSAVLMRLAPELARHLPSATTADEPAGDMRRDLFDATARLFRELARERPVVLVFDDLQWAATPTVALLSHLISTIIDSRLLVLGAFRTTAPDRSDDLTSTIAELYRLEGVRRIDLAGLDTDEIAEYLVRQDGISFEAARSAAPLLRDQTGGNPFFLREVWRELPQRGGLRALRAGRVRAPRSIGDTLERRLAGLSSTARDVIELAAVIGDVCEVATVTAACEADVPQVLAAIDAAAAVGLIEPVPAEATDDAGDYAFVHALSRQAVVDQLSRSKLTDLHARAAAALEPRGAEPQVVPRLAHHYLHCHILGYDKQAAHYAAESARLAERSLAFEDAAQWYQRAAAVPDVDAARRTELLFAAAANHVRAWSFDQAREIYEQLTTSPEPQTRLTAAMGFEDASWRGPGQLGSRTADLLKGALEASDLTTNDPRYIAALGSLGRALTFAGETARARQVGERAVELADEHGDEDLRLHALCTGLWHGTAPEHAEVQFARATEVTTRSRGTRDAESLLGPAAHFRSLASYVLGRPGELEISRAELRHVADTSGQAYFQYVAGCAEQGRSFLRGDFATAERQATELAELGHTFGADDVEGPYGLHMFMIERETGRIDAVRPVITGDEPLRGHWVPALLALYTEFGMAEATRRTLRHVLGGLTDRHTEGALWPAELAFMADAALSLADTGAAELLRPHLERYSGKNLVVGFFIATFGAADRYLARMAALTGDHERAERLFSAALAMDEGIGSVVHTAETLLHYGRHLMRTGNGTRGRQLLERARDIAEPIGQARVLGAIPSRRVGEGPDGLSEREVDVLRLLAEGLSNREIGERLFISANTAANHVRSILMKTRAANRTQAARYAADHHLV